MSACAFVRIGGIAIYVINLKVLSELSAKTGKIFSVQADIYTVLCRRAFYYLILLNPPVLHNYLFN